MVIAVDWGTSSLRAYRLDAAGALRAERGRAADLVACRGRFGALLAELLADWDDPIVVMAGMVGSRNGWHEVPYVAAPTGVDALAAGLCEIAAPELPGRRVFIAPGVVHRPADGAPEVMRGEETQLAGLLEDLPPADAHTVCLPGTHSKWVRFEGGRIAGVRTAMTGELYALLRRHSLLAALMPGAASDAHDDDDDAGAFAQGVAASAREGGLGHHLFGVRSLGLFGALEAAQAPSYLSGLLIGHELRGLLGAARTVHLVGAPALLRRYERALLALGASALLHDGAAAAARGLHVLAARRGLLAA